MTSDFYYDATTITVSASIEAVDTAAGTVVIKYEIYQDGSLIYDERETFDLAVGLYYLHVDFNYTLTDSDGDFKPRNKEGSFEVMITEDSIDLIISLPWL